jgi:hypothetical protein
MHLLPPLIWVEEIQSRLNMIFPSSFPDRTILIGDMSARAHFVGLYGGFVRGSRRFFRPSTVIRFGWDQAVLTSDDARLDWLSRCQSAGFTPIGKQWYADNSRETLRDDLIRNRCVPMGIIVKREGIAPTSPAPIYAFDDAYIRLFHPELTGEHLTAEIKSWQDTALDPATRARMRLLAYGVLEREGEILVTLPTTRKTLRLAAGDASLITRDVCEVMAPMIAAMPVVVHVSMSDKKIAPELSAEASGLGLVLDLKAALPDVIIANIGETSVSLVFVEVVHSDGPITELRKEALLQIAKKMGFKENDVVLVTAFEDRSSDIARKRLGELARDSWVWYRSEPSLFHHLRVVQPGNVLFGSKA